MKIWQSFLIGLGIALGLVMLAGVALLTRTYAYQGTLYEPPVEIADFQLTDQEGELVRFSELRGDGESRAVMLIFFGYTRCPDVCPVTLVEFKRIKEQLKDRAGEVCFVFISVDPERDTPETMRAYLAHFDPNFVGLTGSREELEPVWNLFGVSQEKMETGSAAGYLVSHSSRTYVIDRNGHLRLTYAFGTQPEVIAQDVLHLLKEK